MQLQLRVDLTADDRVVDLARDGIDIAIRTRELDNANLVARRLGHFGRTVVRSDNITLTLALARLHRPLSVIADGILAKDSGTCRIRGESCRRSPTPSRAPASGHRMQVADYTGNARDGTSFAGLIASKPARSRINRRKAMPHTHALDRVHNALAPTALGRAVAGIVLPLRAPRIDGSAAAGAGAIFTKLAFASVIGLAFVIALPFAGIAALAWFAAISCSPRPPEPGCGGCDQVSR